MSRSSSLSCTERFSVPLVLGIKLVALLVADTYVVGTTPFGASAGEIGAEVGAEVGAEFTVEPRAALAEKSENTSEKMSEQKSEQKKTEARKKLVMYRL